MKKENVKKGEAQTDKSETEMLEAEINDLKGRISKKKKQLPPEEEVDPLSSPAAALESLDKMYLEVIRHKDKQIKDLLETIKMMGEMAAGRSTPYMDPKGRVW